MDSESSWGAAGPLQGWVFRDGVVPDRCYCDKGNFPCSPGGIFPLKPRTLRSISKDPVLFLSFLSPCPPNLEKKKTICAVTLFTPANCENLLLAAISSPVCISSQGSYNAGTGGGKFVSESCRNNRWHQPSLRKSNSFCNKRMTKGVSQVNKMAKQVKEKAWTEGLKFVPGIRVIEERANSCCMSFDLHM